MYYKFYESCKPVIGKNRGVVYDLTRGNLYFLPKQILSEFTNYSKFKINKFYSDFKESSATLTKYFNYLLDNELIFYTSDLNQFPKINAEIVKPYLIDVVFLEIDNLNFKFDKVLNIDIFNRLGFSSIVIISQQNSIENLKFIFKLLEKSKISNVTLLIKYELNININIKSILKDNFQLIEVIIYESIIKNNKIDYFNTSKSLQDLLTKRIESINDFSLNQDAYIEALSKNLFFNRKVYIDSNYNVKHSFEDSIIFGNLRITNLDDIILSNSFVELWNITKDQIEVCKDCEFRYICPDNRIPKKLKNKNYYHETICNYDPYTNEWR